MEVWIDWSSSCGPRKRMQQLVSEPSILGGERRLESLQSDAGIREDRRELELQPSDSRWKLESQRSDARWEKWRLEFQQLLRNIISESDGEVTVADKESSFASHVEEVDLQYEARRQQSEARFHERRADTDPQTFIPRPQVEGQEFDSLVSHDGGLDVHQTMATADLDSSSRESHVRAEAEHRSCSTGLDPTDCDLSPMQKTEEHKVRGIDSESYLLSFSCDSMNTFVGKSTGVSEISTMGDDSLIEQHSNIVEEESTMSLKDAIAIYVEEFVNSWNSSMKFDVAARESFDVKAEGLVDEEEKEVSKEGSMGEFDGKYVQMDRTFDAFLSLDSVNVPVNSQIELVKVPMTNKMVVQSPSKCGWSVPNWFAMPKVKMKTEKVGLGNLITASTQEFGEGIQLVDDAFVFLNGKVTKVVAAGSFLSYFGVNTGAGKRLDNAKVKGNELEQYVATFSDYKTCLQAKKLMETECLVNACQNAQLRELATILSVIRNLKRLFVRFPKPTVKMKLMDVPIFDSSHMHTQQGEVRICRRCQEEPLQIRQLVREKESLCLKRSVVQSHYLGSGCSLGSLKKVNTQEACLRGSLRTRNLMGDGLLRSQALERKRSSARLTLLICHLEGHVISIRNEGEGKLRGLNANERKGKQIGYKCRDPLLG